VTYGKSAELLFAFLFFTWEGEKTKEKKKKRIALPVNLIVVRFSTIPPSRQKLPIPYYSSLNYSSSFITPCYFLFVPLPSPPFIYRSFPHQLSNVMAGARSSMRSLRRPFLIGTTVGIGGIIAYKSYSSQSASHTYSVNRDRHSSIPPGGRPNAMGGFPTPPNFPPLPTREEQINRLRAGTEGNEYDLLVIGGGATGSGIALDAASRGLKVAMVERDDFSSGTSSKSTKLVHGGVRYLEKAVKELDYSQYQLVREALKERAVFLTTAPHLSMSLPIMLPVYEWWKAPYFWVGTKVYDFLAGKENLESSYFLTRGKALEAFPMLKGNGLAGALVYYGSRGSPLFRLIKDSLG